MKYILYIYIYHSLYLKIHFLCKKNHSVLDFWIITFSKRKPRGSLSKFFYRI